MFRYAVGAMAILQKCKHQQFIVKQLYLLINFCTIIVPLLFSFHPRLKFYRQFRFFIPANLIVAGLFIIWDIKFTHWGVWGFNPDYVLGIYFLKLPLEELFFFICIPFACVFTYHCINLFFKITWTSATENIFTGGFAIILLIVGIIFYNRLYTFTTFISLAIVLIILKYIMKVKWLPKLFSIYPVLLIPFFIVNGILTGSGLPQPVVWYNNAENMGLRLFTIPVEDIFYGLELIVLNVCLFEYFKTQVTRKNTFSAK